MVMKKELLGLLLVAASLTTALPASPSATPAAASTSSSLPTVQLGYEVHQAASFNATGSYYVFSNVPYANQPVGSRRFKVPSLPTGTSSNVNNGGDTPVACPQALPDWSIYLRAQAAGVSPDVVLAALAAASGQETEACLMLDIYVPKKVLRGCAGKVPVLVWIHDGGYVTGSKTSRGAPSGLLARSTLNSAGGVIVVAINYRLGLFGWLASQSLASGSSVTPNLGLYDQRVALQWIQTYIERFGGDAGQVTVVGQSAGASSLLHQITAYGGASTAPFQRAILQSPAFQFNLDASVAYGLALKDASARTGTTVSSAAALAALDSATLQAVNAAVVGEASPGFYNFGPVVDGTYVPATPQALLREGRLNTDIGAMAAHNPFETGAYLGSVTTDAELEALVAAALPEASNATRAYILGTLYPAAAYGGSQSLRAVQLFSDMSFSCSTRHLALALGGSTYNYLFAMPPGFHADDVPYTFFAGDTSTSDNGYPVNATVALRLQDYLVGFAMSGDPNRSPAGAVRGIPPFPQYSRSAQVMSMSPSGLAVTTDDDKNVRCDWWQTAMVKGLV